MTTLRPSEPPATAAEVRQALLDVAYRIAENGGRLTSDSSMQLDHDLDYFDELLQLHVKLSAQERPGTTTHTIERKGSGVVWSQFGVEFGDRVGFKPFWRALKTFLLRHSDIRKISITMEVEDR